MSGAPFVLLPLGVSPSKTWTEEGKRKGKAIPLRLVPVLVEEVVLFRVIAGGFRDV